MQVSDFCKLGSRIIEIEAADGALGSQLISAGARYLAVATNEQRGRAITEKFPALGKCTTRPRSPRAVCQNNADILILNGRSSLELARFGSVCHARYVAVKLRLTPLCFLAIQLGLLQCILRRFAWPRLVRRGGPDGTPQLIVFRVRRPLSRGARRYVPHVLGFEGFLRRLHTGGVRHAVLRGFDSLPRLAAGEHIDLLVDDRDVARVSDLLDDGPGVEPVNVYSATGLPGSNYCKMAYFPAHLAEEILQRAIDYRGLCLIPAPREHFLSLTYYALYHKGFESGLLRRGENRPQSFQAERSYTTILGDMARRLRIDIPITLEDLDDYLESQGWRPPYDMLVRLSRGNDWLWSLVKGELTGGGADDGLAVFVLREEAIRRGGVERAAGWLEKQGFQIIVTKPFDARLAHRVARKIRGGNWGQGTWKIPSGGPVAAIVVYDPAPIRHFWGRRRRRLPYVANARLYCKRRLRDHFNEGYAKDQRCNVVHSSDNGREALEYLRIIMQPEEIGDVLSRTGSPQRRRAA